MREILLRKTWLIKAPVSEVFRMMTDFEKFPQNFPKVTESVTITKREGDLLAISAILKSFGQRFRVQMKTRILPDRGFISDNESPEFGTSGHEELILSARPEGTLIDYTYQVTIHKRWLRIVATPLIRWYAMKFWEKAVIDELRAALER